MFWGDTWGDLWGGSPPTITTHETDAIKRLPDFLDKQNEQDLIAIFGDRAQALEDTLENLAWLYDIRTAYGARQDTLGAILGESRNAQSDADYRRFQRARSQQVQHRRTAENLLSVLRYLVNDDTRSIALVDTYPKAYKLIVENLTAAEIVAFLPFVKRSKPVTYQGKFIVTVTGAFGHSDASATLPPAPPPRGFGDASGTIIAGGPLSYIVPF